MTLVYFLKLGTKFPMPADKKKWPNVNGKYSTLFHSSHVESRSRLKSASWMISVSPGYDSREMTRIDGGKIC